MQIDKFDAYQGKSFEVFFALECNDQQMCMYKITELIACCPNYKENLRMLVRFTLAQKLHSITGE